MMMDDNRLQGIQERLEAARAELSALCKGKRWLMTIPADPRHDSDLIIAAALRDIPALLELCKDAEAALSWPQSFYNDVMNTTPEYADLCGDWNAVQYMQQDCEGVRQRLRAALEAQP